MVFKKSKNKKYQKSYLQRYKKTKKKQKYKNNSLPIRIMKGGSLIEEDVIEKLIYRLKFFPDETTQDDNTVLINLIDFTKTPGLAQLIKEDPKKLPRITVTGETTGGTVTGATTGATAGGTAGGTTGATAGGTTGATAGGTAGATTGGKAGGKAGGTESEVVKGEYDEIKRSENFEDFYQYVDRTQLNISNLNDKLTDNYILEKTYVTFFDTHGSIRYLDFQVVPEDTIICFLAPINNLSYINMNDTYKYNRRDLDLYHVMNYLTFNQYIELFKYRERIGNRNQEVSFVENIIKLGNAYTHLSIYNCFMNSVFLYPGQVYPNMDLSISSSDILKGGSRNNMNRLHFKFLDVETTTTSGKKIHTIKNIKASNSVYGKPFYDREEVVQLLKGGGKQIKVELKNVVDYVRPDTHRKIKMVIVPSCRGISNVDNLSIYYQLEVINQEINRMAMSDHFSRLNPDVPNIGINTTCGFLSYKQVLLNQMNYQGFAGAEKFTRDHHYNFNYSGHIPKLIEIFERVTNKALQEFDVSDSVYLASLTPSKLFRFLYKLKNNSLLSPEIYSLLVNSLIKKAGGVLVENLKKNIGYLNLPLLNTSYFSTLKKSIKDIRRNLEMIQSILDEVFKMDIGIPILREISEDIHRNINRVTNLGKVGGYFFCHKFQPTNASFEEIDIYMIDVIEFDKRFMDHIIIQKNLKTLHIHNKNISMKLISDNKNQYIELQSLNIIGNMILDNDKTSQSIQYICDRFPGIVNLSCENVTNEQDINLSSTIFKNLKTVILVNCNFSHSCINTFYPYTLQTLHIIKNDSLSMLDLINYVNLNEILLQDLNKLKIFMSMEPRVLGSIIFRYINPEDQKNLNISLIHNTIGKLEIDGCSKFIVNLSGENFSYFTIKKSSTIDIRMANDTKKIQNLEIEHSTDIKNLEELLLSTSIKIKLREIEELKKKNINFWKKLNIHNLDIDAGSASDIVLEDMMSNPTTYKYDININF